MAATVTQAVSNVTDLYVDHISTIPANVGHKVKLFVREHEATSHGAGPRRPVLMLHGRSVAGVAAFDLPGKNKRYSWAAQLAKAGHDVYVMELQGSGLSTRPKMDDHRNVSPAEAQRRLLVPNPNPEIYTGPVEYGKQLNNSQSDWDEVGAVVDFVLDRTGVTKLDLIGYSAGAQQLGPYAIKNPGKVRSLFLAAPIFPPNGRKSKAGTDFDAPVPMPVSLPEGAFAYPMTVGTKDGLKLSWERDLKCPDQREPDMLDEAWKAMMAADPIGATWGGTVPGSPDGLNRIRNSYWWGWNSTTVQLHKVLGDRVPVCIVYGEHDSIINTSPDLGLTYFSTPELYRKIPGTKKLMFRISCAGHQLLWERQAKLVHTMSEHWLKHGKVEGATSGSYDRDADGALTLLEE
ncbi:MULTISPECIES: alpha/beta fold hydrolase [Streptomyces]|uniref:Alpha/beta hydrolase n=1 Tax=Streptomyces venezuelae TaxID=54571 RepID=A0A5P2ANV7_STRVZ|nr:alpha/beta fold hydrolase [Streptomyces venezuelae]QES19240.1 alpha/beta hydrolase [Streptomyces venezuelae]